jgi:RecA-family ATPase
MSESEKRLAMILAADVRIQPVAWTWQGRIPLGKVSGIDGMMGRGKTQILVNVLAAVTRGTALPGQDATPQSDVILISLEDGYADTIVPRLMAADANLFRVHLFDGYMFGGERTDGMFSLAEDIERLRWAIEEHDAHFVGIDPFTAALPSQVNSYKDQDVRRLLAPLAKVAEDTETAIVFTRHFRKGGGAPEDAGGGSVGIGAACRSVLRVDTDPENPERFLLSSVKSSVSKKPPTIGYHIEGVEIPYRQCQDVQGPALAPVKTSKIVWEGESTWTAETLAAQAMGSEERPRTEEAQDWLRDALSGGSRQAKELFRTAEADGIAKRTLHRAADALQVVKERKGFGEGSTWSLPSFIRAKISPFVPSKSMAQMGTNGTNGTHREDTEPDYLSPEEERFYLAQQAGLKVERAS